MRDWMKAEPVTYPPEGERFLLSEGAVLWATVIDNLAIAFPASRLATLDDEAKDRTGTMWASTLSDIPLEAIPPLQIRVLRAWTFSNPPTMGDFRKAWDAWDFYAERARSEVEARPAVAALTEGDSQARPAAAGPCYYANKRQLELLGTRGQMITCDCLNGAGFNIPCTLTDDLKTWVCAHDIPLKNPNALAVSPNGGLERPTREPMRPSCGFEWPVEREKDAPRRAELKPKSRAGFAAAAEVIEPAKPVVTKSAPRPLSGVELVCENLGYDLDAMDDVEMARLTGFVNWWGDNVGPVRELTNDQVVMHFPAWLEKQEAGALARGAR